MEDLRLSPLRLGSFKSSPPRGSPTFRRVHSGRTPRREVKANGGALQWFRSNRLIYWLLLITLWTYLGFYVQSRWAHDDDNKVEFLRFGGKLREDVLHVEQNTRVGSVVDKTTHLVVDGTNVVHVDVNKRMHVALAKKEDATPRRSLSARRRRRRKAGRSSRSKTQKVRKVVEDLDEQDPELPKTNVTYGKLFGPFGSIEDRILEWSPQKRSGTCDRNSDFKRLVWSRRFVLLFHELSMTGAPISMMELASELLSCGATVYAVVLSRRGGLLQELIRRRIKVVEDKGELSFKTAMKADLVVAGSAVCATWIGKSFTNLY